MTKLAPVTCSSLRVSAASWSTAHSPSIARRSTVSGSRQRPADIRAASTAFAGAHESWSGDEGSVT
eukprot:324015-Pleurochrysis_carterae.AAC.1